MLVYRCKGRKDSYTHTHTRTYVYPCSVGIQSLYKSDTRELLTGISEHKEILIVPLTWSSVYKPGLTENGGFEGDSCLGPNLPLGNLRAPQSYFRYPSPKTKIRVPRSENYSVEEIWEIISSADHKPPNATVSHVLLSYREGGPFHPARLLGQRFFRYWDEQAAGAFRRLKTLKPGHCAWLWTLWASWLC